MEAQTTPKVASPGITFKVVRRNLVSVAVPLITGYLIYKDYTRTQAYKASKVKRVETSS